MRTDMSLSVRSAAGVGESVVAARPARFETSARRVAVWCRVRWATVVVWCAMAAWGIAVFEKVKADHASFRTLRFDLGNMVQAVWSTAHGRPLEFTFEIGEQLVRLAVHVDPILVLLAPAWLLVPDPMTVATIQVVAVATGALPVLWLARRHLGSEAAAACVALAYLAYPWIVWTAADAMHPVTLGIPLLLYAVWFLDQDRLVPFATVAVLAALTGELVGLSIAALGVWYGLAHGRRLVGAAIAVLATAWSLVAVLVIVPTSLGGPSIYYSQYASVGGSPKGVLRTAIVEPGTIASALTAHDDIAYLLLLAAPLLGLFFLSPGIAAVAVPQLLINGLSDRPTMTDPRFHYVAGVIPFLFVGTVFGLKRLSPAWRVRGAALLLAVCVVSLVVAGPVPSSPVYREVERAGRFPAEHLVALNAALELVPAGAPVTSTNGIGAHVSARRYVYGAPVVGPPGARAEWAVLDMRNAWMPFGPRGGTVYPERLEAFRRRLERSPDWEKVFERDYVLVFRRLAGDP